MDNLGNIYVADTFNHVIRRMTQAGVVTTFAGMAGSPGNADGKSGAARFRSPRGVAVDRNNDIVYVADTGNHTIRKITPAGVVTTLAGIAGISGGANGTGSAARFDSPRGLAVSSEGSVFVAESIRHVIRKITSAGVVTTFAGTSGVSGSTNGNGSVALFNAPNGVAIDFNNNIYIADSGNRTIRKITPSADVTTLAGTPGLDGDDNGIGAAARFRLPVGIATDTSNNVYVADSNGHSIRMIVPATGAVTTIAGMGLSNPGSTDGPGATAKFSLPGGLTAGGGSVFVADTNNETIRKIASDKVVTTLAGTVGGGEPANGTGSAARFSGLSASDVDGSNNLFVADFFSVRKVTPAGVVTTFAGTLGGPTGADDGVGGIAKFNRPEGISFDGSGNLFVADTFNNTIRQITPGAEVTTYAGEAPAAGDINGSRATARFNRPSGLFADSFGNVLVADTENHLLRLVTADGVTTWLGTSGVTGTADGPAEVALFSSPNSAVLFESAVYVADGDNHSIRRISTATRSVTTLAGSSGTSGSADGQGSAARFLDPRGINTDSSGNLYVADSGNHTIRRITPAGLVTTLGGTAGISGTADGTGSAARFSSPRSVVVSGDGILYVMNANSIRKGAIALTDVATIDSPTGPVFVSRQLGTSPQTASFFQWTVLRRPAGSTAQFSNSTIPNPGFVPDVADVYVFQLKAFVSGASSITTVTLNATGELLLQPPTNLEATSTGPQQISLTWTGSAGANEYQVFRMSNGGGLTSIVNVAGTSFIDSGLPISTAFYYVVRAENGTSRSGNSSPAIAGTFTFSDDPIVPGQTVVHSAHLIQLRDAVDALRATAGLADFSYFDDPVINTDVQIIKFHMLELRSVLSQTFATLGLTAPTFTDAVLTGKPIRAVHFQEPRALLR